MEFLIVVDSVPAGLVLLIGLVVLLRRRAPLGARGLVAVAGVATMLAVLVVNVVLSFASFQRVRSMLDGSWRPTPWWADLVDLVELAVLPAELVALPLLAWAVLAGRSPRRAADPAGVAA